MMAQVQPSDYLHFPSYLIPMEGADTMVECPLCQEFVVNSYINQHIDSGCKEVDFAPLTSNGRFKSNDDAAKAWGKMFSMSKPK